MTPTVTITENIKSRSGSDGKSGKRLRLYTCKGSSSLSTILEALNDFVPDTAGGLELLYCRANPRFVDINNLPRCNWDGEAHYGYPEKKRPTTGESIRTFSSGGGTTHITQRIEALPAQSYKADGITGEIPDFKGGIGVTIKGRESVVAGVDIYTPAWTFEETHYFSNETMTAEYQDDIEFCHGKINIDEFRGRAAGEVLFIGATGRQRGGEDWEVTFRFAVSKNKSNFRIGDITIAGGEGEEKLGWDYLWLLYEDFQDEAAGKIVKRAAYAYVDPVYYSTLFSALGI